MVERPLKKWERTRPPHDGWCDPNGLLWGFRRKAVELGAVYVKDRVVAAENGSGEGFEAWCSRVERPLAADAASSTFRRRLVRRWGRVDVRHEAAGDAHASLRALLHA